MDSLFVRLISDSLKSPENVYAVLNVAGAFLFVSDLLRVNEDLILGFESLGLNEVFNFVFVLT